MNKLLRKRLSNQRGVTLIELLAVIVIIGILAAVAVPAVLNQISDSKVGADVGSAATIKDAAERYLVQHPETTTLKVEDLVSAKFLKEAPTPQETGKTSFIITIDATTKQVTVTTTGSVTPPTGG